MRHTARRMRSRGLWHLILGDNAVRLEKSRCAVFGLLRQSHVVSSYSIVGGLVVVLSGLRQS